MTFIKSVVFLMMLSFVSAANDDGYKLIGNHTNDYYMDLEIFYLDVRLRFTVHVQQV